MTQNHKNMRMHDLNDALSTRHKLYLLYFLLFKLAVLGLSNKYVYRYQTVFSFFKENA